MDKVEFSLKKVETKQFAIIDTAYDSSDDKVALEMGLSFGLNAENFAIISIVKFQFKQNDKPFLLIEASCELDIEAEKWNSFLQKNKKSILLPRDVMTHLVAITLGTIRGILHAKTENTKFNQFLLPIINLQEVITEANEFEV